MLDYSSLGSAVLVLALSFLVSVPLEVKAVDEEYRVSPPFEGIEVTRQSSEALQQQDYSKLKNSVDLLEPMMAHLNEQYSQGGKKLTLGQTSLMQFCRRTRRLFDEPPFASFT